ncbi:hypothetical protein MJT46_002149 [Ovis ammon polii x Ovis aries]|nr:hypothetical protein MJT46_002149 [Ovis ammon polii x Ovis aries]
MDEEPIIYSITALNQDFQQRHTPKNIKDKLNPNELPLTKKKLKHQKPCKKQHKNIAEDVNDEASSKKPSLKIQQKDTAKGKCKSAALIISEEAIFLHLDLTLLIVLRFSDHSMEVDFWDFRSNMPFDDDNFGSFVEKLEFFLSLEKKIICNLMLANFFPLRECTHFPRAFTKQSVQLGPSTDLQEESGCFSCQEKWIGYQHNCYFVSNELKTWKDSRDFCVSHNSSLLQIQTRNELDFMKFNTNFYWIGLSYDEEHHAWLWEDNSTLSQDLFPFLKSVNPKNCMMYIPIGTILDGHCETKSRYICKQQLI